MSNKKVSVVVTGVGAVAPNGKNARDFYQNCISGVTGIRESSVMKDFNYMTKYAGEIVTDKPLRWESKFREIGERACADMLEDAQISKEYIEKLKERAVFSLASANLGSLRLEPLLRIKYGFDYTGITYDPGEYIKSNCSMLDFNSADCFYHFSNILGISGNVMGVNAACASGTLAIGEAVRMIETGRADMAVTAGIDVLSDLSLAGFNSLENLSTTPCKPFDINREGITIGEGAAFIMLEREDLALQRGAKIYGRIFGFASMNEAYQVTAPDPSRKGAFFCMNKVLEKIKGLQGKSLYINAHGTSTSVNDAMEIKAMELLSQTHKTDHLWFSSTKSMIGHCLGAAGSLEFVCSVIGLKEGTMPVSISVENPMEYDNKIMTLVTDKSKSRQYDLFLSNSFAFAGNMACIGVEQL